MKRKIGLLLLIFFTGLYTVFAFNFSAYLDSTLEDIDNFIIQNRIDRANSGMSLFGFRYNIILENVHYSTVVPTPNVLKLYIQAYSNQTGISDTHGEDFFRNLYGYAFLHQYRDNNYVFFIQNGLANPFIEHIKHNRQVRIFILLGLIENYTNSVFIFINSFQ